MASNRNFYEIDVTVAFNGAACKNYDVVFEKPTECANVRCEYSKGKILVEIPKDCTECVTAIVTCNDDKCLTCSEPEKITICPCTTDADCGNCQECINGLCVSTCKGEEFCSDEGICVDCDDDNPCPANQVCVSGDCQCPPDKPYKNSKGVCVSCDENHPCPPCTYCTPEGCKPIICPEGVCDPTTGKCVECNGTGDCDGENECCVDNKCDCCEGFVRDYGTGLCVPQGCTTDTECPDCFICYQGQCIPRECPEGYICVDDDCKKECDCSDATCGVSEACVAADANKCYCKPCEGTCVTGADCGEGCTCVNGECVPNPCKGSCTNGTDCGPDCGCQDGECVPCADASCANDDCTSILGCGCLGNGCGDVGGCSGGCSSSYDCGPGCTCYEGECVACANFSCETSECVSRPGCACIDGTCGDDGDDDSCADTFTLTKDDENCDLTATLVKEEGCSCSKLTIDNKLSNVTLSGGDYLLDILVELRKGEIASVAAINTIPLLGDTNNENIADNEKPTSGLVEIQVTTTYREVNESGAFVGLTTGPVVSYSASMVNKDSHTFTGVVVQSIGKQVSDLLFVYKVDVTIRQATNLVFPNGCIYTAPKIVNEFTITKNDDFNAIIGGNALRKLKFAGFVTISSLSNRSPMFTWYRSNNGTYSSDEIIRKIYVPVNGGQYIDTLYGLAEIPEGKYPLETPEGELWSGKYFSVKNDCACTKDADAGKVVFCNPTELFYELSMCNTKLTLLEPFEPCDVNQDITQWETTGYDIPNAVQTKYKLYINGVLKYTFVHDKNLGMVKDGTSDSMFDLYTFTEPITEIKLVINHDTSDECTLVYDVESPDEIDVDKTINCSVSGSTYQVTIPKVGGDYVITSMTSSHGVIVNGVGSFVLTLPKATNVTLTYTFASGCTKTEIINEDCCTDFTVTLNAATDECGGPVSLSVIPVGGQSPYSVTYTFPNGSTVTTTGGGTTDNTPISGTYSVSVTDANGCVATDEANVTSSIAPEVLFSGYSDICDGGETNILINTDANGVGGIIHYTANGSPSTLIVSGGGTASIGPISTASEYVFTQIDVNGCEFPLTEVITISITDEFVASVSPGNTTICNGSDVTFTVTGGVTGCTVQLKKGATIVDSAIFDGDGEATLTDDPTTTTVYTISVINSCGVECFSGLPVNRTVTVVSGPTISITDSECDVTLTEKTITFNLIDSAVDQLGNTVVVTGSSITVDPNDVTSVTVTYDAGTCVVTETFAVTPCVCPTVTITLPNQTINNGDSATLTPIISGGSGSYSYSWSTGQTASSITVSPTTTTSYSLILTDNVNGCIYNKTVTVIVVDCTGDLDTLVFSDCSCVELCTFTFNISFLSDYAGCGINELLTNLNIYIDGSGTPSGDWGWSFGDRGTLVLTYDPGVGPCSLPATSIRIAGTVYFTNDIGNACCNGTSVAIDETILITDQPGDVWGCSCP